MASHYRNTPNDLLLMADAPAHRLFVLLGHVDDTLNALPDILAVVQVCNLSISYSQKLLTHFFWLLCWGHAAASSIYYWISWWARRHANGVRVLPSIRYWA